MKHFLYTLLAVAIFSDSFAQQPKLWTEKERTYLLQELTRSRDSVIAETKGLSKAQWNFKESADRWSINQVVEHLCFWELILQREINQAFIAGPRPELAKEARTDSAVLAFLGEETVHIAPEYTKPFTFTIPMGLNPLENNMAWFLKMRNEDIGYVDTTTMDLRAYFMRPRKGSVHQVFMTIFAHTNRHLRQVRKVKLHPNYPKK
jgi:hypothetical protein